MRSNLVLSALLCLLFSFANAQPTYVTTVPPLNGGNGSNGIAFNVKAYNPITIKAIWVSCLASTTPYTVDVWYRTDSVFYNATTTHPAISTANGWVLLASSVNINVVTGGNGTLDSIRHGFNLPMPAGSTYGFFIAGTGFSRYTSLTTGPSLFADGNMHINTGNNVGWAGPASGPNFHPRQFNGKIGYELSCVANVTAHPNNQTTCAGSNASFAVTGSAVVTTYQWQVNTGSGFSNVSNGGVYAGATTNTLNITGATAGMNTYLYRCEVSNGTCSLTSNSAVLTVGSTATSITTPPPNRSICVGANTTFGVTAAGSNLSYQWQVDQGSGFSNVSNTGVYSNATTATLTITGATIGMNTYKYRCVVNGICAPLSVTSADGTLTVNPLPSFSAHPPDRTVCTGNNTTFTVTQSGGTTYQWQVNTGSGFSNLSNNSTYTDVATPTLIVNNITAGMNTYKYRCIASNAVCSGTSNEGTLTVNTLPAVTGHPANKTICAGDATTFSVTATGTSPTYLWFVNTGTGYNALSNGGMYSGVTSSTLSVSGVIAAMNGYQYRCQVSGTCTPIATSNGGTLTVNTSPSVTMQPIDDTICEGGNASFAITATGTNLNYQWEEDAGTGFVAVPNNAKYAGSTTNTLTITNGQYNMDNYKYRCVVTGTCNPFEASQFVRLRVNKITKTVTDPPDSLTTCNGVDLSMTAVFDGSDLLYQWQESSGGPFINLSNMGIYSGVHTSTLQLTAPTPAVDAKTYRCMVSGACGATLTTPGTYISVYEFPLVTSDPADIAVEMFSHAIFKITATGTSIKYQWQVKQDTVGTWQDLFDNFAYSGTQTNELKVTGTYLSKDGYLYRCIVKGVCGIDDTSNVSILTVVPPPNNISTVAGEEKGITLYPNPVKGNQLTLKMDEPVKGNLHIKIIDQFGRVLSDADVKLTAQNTALVDINMLVPGVYNMQVSNGTQILSTLKFTKQ